MMARLGTEVRLADVFDSASFEAAPEAEVWLREQSPRLAIAAGTCGQGAPGDTGCPQYQALTAP
jgi:hypothetical protein